MWIEFPLFSIQWISIHGFLSVNGDKRKTFESIENYTRLAFFYDDDNREQKEKRIAKENSNEFPNEKTWTFFVSRKLTPFPLFFYRPTKWNWKEENHEGKTHLPIDVQNRKKKMFAFLTHTHTHQSRSKANYYMDKHVCWLSTFKTF